MYVNNTVVINYVNDIAPAKLMYSLNFHMRKRNQLLEKVEQKDSE